MNKKAIRASVGSRPGVRRVRITRRGEIIATGEMPRHDGGFRTWSMFVGNVLDPEWREWE